MSVPIQVLRASSLFAGFTDTGLAILAQIARLRDIPQGMSVFIEGSPGDSLFVVVQGTLEIVSGQGDGAKLLCVLQEGDHFGELALLRARRRLVGARARTACRLAELKRAEFGELIKQKPQACMKLMLAIVTTLEHRVDALRDELLTSL